MVNQAHITEIRHTSKINGKQTYHSVIRYDYNNKYYSNELTYNVTDDYKYEDYTVGTTIKIYDYTYQMDKVKNISGQIKIVNDRVEEAVLFNKEMTTVNFTKYFNNSIVGDLIDHTLEQFLNENEEEQKKYLLEWTSGKWMRVQYNSKEGNNSIYKKSQYDDYILKLHDETRKIDGVKYTEAIRYDTVIKMFYFHQEYFK